MSTPALGATEPKDDAVVTLSAEEQAAVADVIASYLRAIPAERQQPYTELLAAAETGTIDADQVAALEQVCALALQTGQARRIGLAEVETLVAAVYRRTPAGRARLAEVKDINTALARLQGQQLRNVRVASPRPGRHTLTLGVPGFEITLAITPDGLEISSLNTS
jgi:hypothetical protein